MFVFIIPEMRIYEGHWQNLQFRKLRQTSWFNGSLLNFFTGGYQLGNASQYQEEYALSRMFLSFISTDRISSFCSTWDHTGLRSFRYQAQKYHKEAQCTSGETQ